VYLKREDGKEVKVLFDKLSSEDQLYVNWYLRSCHPLERLMKLVPLMLDQAERLLQGGQDNEARKICSAIDRFAANNDAMFNEILIPTRLVYLNEKDNRIMDRSFTREEVVSLVRVARYVQTGRYNFDFFATPAEKEAAAAAAEAAAQREQRTQQEILSTFQSMREQRTQQEILSTLQSIDSELQSIDSELLGKRLDEWYH